MSLKISITLCRQNGTLRSSTAVDTPMRFISDSRLSCSTMRRCWAREDMSRIGLREVLVSGARWLLLLLLRFSQVLELWAMGYESTRMHCVAAPSERINRNLYTVYMYARSERERGREREERSTSGELDSTAVVDWCITHWRSGCHWQRTFLLSTRDSFQTRS